MLDKPRSSARRKARELLRDWKDPVPEDMVTEDLLAWANGLVLCEFSVTTMHGKEVVMAGDSKLYISLSFGRYSERYDRDPNGRFISVCTLDTRHGGYACMSAPCSFLDEAQYLVELYAEKLGLACGQLRLL